MDKYQNFILDLFPNGSPWPKDKSSLLWEVSEIIAERISRWDRRFDQLVSEMDPRKAKLLMVRWEQELGISSSGADISLQERQEQIFRYYVGGLDLNIPALIGLVESITGIRPTIQTPYPLTVGELRAGDELDGEPTAHTIYVTGVPASKKLFDALKEYTEGHVLMVIDTGTEKIPVKGIYAEN